MSEAVAPSRAMRSRANRRESSVARGIELDSPSLKSTDLAGLYHVERPRETWCRVTLCHAVPVRLEALRHRAPPARHELRPRRRTGPVCRLERDPQAIVSHRVQLPHRAELLPEADAPLVQYSQSSGAAMGSIVRP